MTVVSSSKGRGVGGGGAGFGMRATAGPHRRGGGGRQQRMLLAMRATAALLLALLVGATLLAFLLPIDDRAEGQRPDPDLAGVGGGAGNVGGHPSRLRFRIRRKRGAGLLGQRQAGPHRMAIIIPFVVVAQSAESFPSYLPAFCFGASLARDVADFLVFYSDDHHDGEDEASSSSFDAALRELCPSNVIFISLGSAQQFAEILLKVVLDFKLPRKAEETEEEGEEEEVEEEEEQEDPDKEPEEERKRREGKPPPPPRLAFDSREQLIQVVARHVQAHPYSLVEYKPAYGYIFQEFLREYSHWGYADVDMVFGDLGRWVEDDELSNYDIVTYGYGDQSRAYLRGQFTFHRNDPDINLLWRDCAYLSNLDARLADALRGKSQYRFESAEGCYSAAILNRTDLRVKYAVKAWTDVNDHQDPAGTHGLYVSRNVDDGRGVIYKAAVGTAATAETQGNGTAEASPAGLALVGLSSRWFETDRAYRDRKRPLQAPAGEFHPVALPDTAGGRDKDSDNPNCMFWVQKKYQRALCLSDSVAATENLYWLHGKLYKRAFVNVPLESGVQTGPFFHFQEWKRYYRPSQLAPLHLGSRVPNFVLAKEGAIPLPDGPSDGGANLLRRAQQRRRRPLPPSPLQASLKQWTSASASDADTDRRSVLPRRRYCVASGPRRFPPKPPASECYAEASWRDGADLEILSRAPGWSTSTVDVDKDVTLVLTLQVTPPQGRDRQALADAVDLLLENLARWRGRPSVAVIHVAGGGTEEGVAYLRRCFDPLQNSPRFDAALVAVLYQEEDDVASRKALMNMAIDAVPTRWYVSGLELERGLVLSADAVVLAHRAAQANRQTRGRVFLIPQFAQDGSEGSTIGLSLGDLARERELGNVKAPSAVEESCASESTVRLDKADGLWWADVQGMLGAEAKAETDLSERAQRIQEMETDFVEYLTDRHHLKMFALDESPILLTDNLGPYDGIRTDEVAREVEELGGRRCYNGLRLAQFAALGYQLDVLAGAYAVSTPESRRAASSAGVDENSMTGSSRCDGCFMFAEQHEEILEDIITDEIRRVGKAAVLWAEKYENAKWIVNEE